MSAMLRRSVLFLAVATLLAATALADPAAIPADPAQLRAGLRLTGTFLRRHLFDASERPVPEARERLIGRLARSTIR